MGLGPTVTVSVAAGRGVRVGVADGVEVAEDVGVGVTGGVGASPSTVKVPTTFHCSPAKICTSYSTWQPLIRFGFPIGVSDPTGSRHPRAWSRNAPARCRGTIRQSTAAYWHAIVGELGVQVADRVLEDYGWVDRQEILIQARANCSGLKMAAGLGVTTLVNLISIARGTCGRWARSGGIGDRGGGGDGGREGDGGGEGDRGGEGDGGCGGQRGGGGKKL